MGTGPSQPTAPAPAPAPAPARQAVEIATATAPARQAVEMATATAVAPSAVEKDAATAVATRSAVSDTEMIAQIDEAMVQIERLRGKNPTSEQVLTAYRIMLLNDKRFNPPSKYGVKASKRVLFPKILEDPTVTATMNILGDGTDDGGYSIVVKDMNEWAGGLSKTHESFSVPGIGGISIKDLLVIAVLAFIFFQVMMNHRKIKAALKKVLKR